MATKKITVVVYPSEDCYVAYMPLFPGCTTQGNTVEDALRMAKESLELALYEPDEFDLWALDAYSGKFPVVAGPDWKFGEDAQRAVDEMLAEQPEGATEARR